MGCQLTGKFSLLILTHWFQRDLLNITIQYYPGVFIFFITCAVYFDWISCFKTLMSEATDLDQLSSFFVCPHFLSSILSMSYHFILTVSLKAVNRSDFVEEEDNYFHNMNMVKGKKWQVPGVAKSIVRIAQHVPEPVRTSEIL